MLKYFSKIGCGSENDASFLWLQYSALLVCVLLGGRGHSKSNHVHAKVHTPQMLHI